jgi:hypothetical protein
MRNNYINENREKKRGFGVLSHFFSFFLVGFECI